MNEEPKSIWRRSWKGPLGTFLWIVSLTVVISIIAFAEALREGHSFIRAMMLAFEIGLAFFGITLVIAALVAVVRWFCTWRNLRRVLFVLVCLATLVALFYAEENLRGKYAWKKFKTEWEAKGKRFDLASLAPPPVPDEQNFAMAPVLIEAICATMGKTNCRTWYGDKVDGLDATNLVSSRWEMQLYNGEYGQKYPASTGGWQQGERFGLKQWQDYLLLNKWRAYDRMIATVLITNSALSDGHYFLDAIDPTTGLPLVPPPQDDDSTNIFYLPAEPQPGDDVKTWQDYFRARWAPLKPEATNLFPLPVQGLTPADDVLSELRKFDSTIEELRLAGRRPYSRFPIRYQQANPAMILLVHLSLLKRCAHVLELRSVAEVQSGRTEKALDDIKLMLRLTESVRTEPIMISHLVRVAMVQLLLQPVWEGLADHRWTDTQLAELEAGLGKLDFLADYDLAMNGEMALSVGTLDYFRRTRELRETVEMFKAIISQRHDSVTNWSDEAFVWLARFGPGGWFDQNKVASCRLYVNLLLLTVNLEARTVSPTIMASATNAFNETYRTPCNWLAQLTFPWSTQSPKKFAYAQWSVDAARIACALERYRLAYGSYPDFQPETLERYERAHGHYPNNPFDLLKLLAPQFLKVVPRDLINGQLMCYRRTFADRFVLYSVGWNGTDDGGTLPINEEGRLDYNQGDWVWQMPAK